MGGQVGGYEGDVKAADEEAGDEEQVAAVPEGSPDRFAHRDGGLVRKATAAGVALERRREHQLQHLLGYRLVGIAAERATAENGRKRLCLRQFASGLECQAETRLKRVFDDSHHGCPSLV